MGEEQTFSFIESGNLFHILCRQGEVKYIEVFYHAFLAGIFTGAGYMVDSNKEHGKEKAM